MELCEGYGPRRHVLANACAQERSQLWHMHIHTGYPGALAAMFTQIELSIITNVLDHAENNARIVQFLSSERTNLLSDAHRPSHIAESSRLRALIILRKAQSGGIPPEGRQKAGEEAIMLAREAVALSVGDPNSIVFSIDETLTAQRVLHEVIKYFDEKKNNKKK